jgi:hypothetical protein
VPIHDWTRVPSCVFHDFHQGWTIEIKRMLNRGLLPPGYSASIYFNEAKCEPDYVTMQSIGPPISTLKSVADSPPYSTQIARLEMDSAVYARNANRIAIRHEFGNVVAIIEVVSSGNKKSVHAIRSFTTKAIEFLGNGVNFVVIDLFPPTPQPIRDLVEPQTA